MSKASSRENTPLEARLAEVIAAYGADPARWPEEVRSAEAQDLARRDPALLAIAAEEAALDAVLALAKTETAAPAASSALRARLLQAAPVPADGAVARRPTPARPLRLPTFEAWLRPAGALVAAVFLLTLGAGAGRLAAPLAPAAAPPEETLLTYVFSERSYEWVLDEEAS